MSDPRREVLAAHRDWAEHARLTDEITRARAELAAATGEQRPAVLDRVRRLEQERLAIGGAERGWQEALRALEAWADAGPQATELRAVGQRLTAVDTELAAVREAIRSAVRAGERLHTSLDLLSRAHSWTNLDVHGGAGTLADAGALERIEQSRREVDAADRALAVLGDQLADLGLPGPAPVTAELTFDWALDFSARHQVREALGRADAASRATHAVWEHLEQRRGRLEQETATMRARQAELALALSRSR